jgi:hypothetical protein
MSSLHEHISPKRLPKKYGGMHDEFSYRLWIDNMERNPEVMRGIYTKFSLPRIVPEIGPERLLSYLIALLGKGEKVKQVQLISFCLISLSLC